MASSFQPPDSSIPIPKGKVLLCCKPFLVSGRSMLGSNRTVKNVYVYKVYAVELCMYGPLGPRGLAEATEMCTQECLVLGHSDNCWMPPSLGPFQQPKSPLSTFAPQKDWLKKDKLVNGHTLTKTWKEDSNKNQFNDRNQYGSTDGQFSSGNHMSDIPLANLKSYKQVSGALDSPMEQQL